MDAAVASTDALAVISFFLTLVGLLGSFFYIHLSDWLRDIIALETKWRINSVGDGADLDAARRECSYEIEIKKDANRTTLLTSVVVTVFVIFIFVLGVFLWQAQPEKSVAWMYIGLAGIGFLIIYLGMTVGLLGSGLLKVRKLYSAIAKYYQDI